MATAPSSSSAPRRPFRTVCVSGYFDPLHVGHVSYLRNARLLGDRLVVILNHDGQRSAVPRLPLEDRRTMLEAIRYVDEVVVAVDEDAHVGETLRRLRPTIFAKGMHASAVEAAVCGAEGIQIVEGVGSELHLHDLMASLR